MTFTEMSQAFTQAKSQIEMADDFADRMARMLEGRLQRVNHSTLKRLKKELARYNAHTGYWQP